MHVLNINQITAPVIEHVDGCFQCITVVDMSLNCVSVNQPSLCCWSTHSCSRQLWNVCMGHIYQRLHSLWYMIILIHHIHTAAILPWRYTKGVKLKCPTAVFQVASGEHRESEVSASYSNDVQRFVLRWVCFVDNSFTLTLQILFRARCMKKTSTDCSWKVSEGK